MNGLSAYWERNPPRSRKRSQGCVYNLRVSIRFGLEQALVTSALAVKDREELYHFDVFPRNSSHAAG
jgi:hypothetical protein